jgi:hypothetical protein
VNPESSSSHQRSQVELSLESSKKSINELAELLANSDLSLIVSSIKQQLLFLERSVSSDSLSIPSSSTSTLSSTDFPAPSSPTAFPAPSSPTAFPAPSSPTSSPAFYPAPSTSTSRSTAFPNPAPEESSSENPASIPIHLSSSPVLKLPEAFARSSKHRNYRKRNFGGMTSDEVMNDFCELEEGNKRLEEEKEERKRQRLEKAEFTRTLKNMKRENIPKKGIKKTRNK